MQYRKLGKSGIDVSILGFGCMRLPVIDNGDKNVPAYMRPVNEEETEKMIAYAVEKGINYFDTAYIYHEGTSETILGRTVKPYRDKIMIATKLPSILVKEPSDIEKFIDEQLKRLDTDYVDFYLLHGLGRESWARMKEFGALEFLDRLLSDGRIQHTGFSFHDDIQIFKDIVDSYNWTLCQIQYNFFDENRQAGREGLKYAADKGVGTVIMEPLRGGCLTEKIPASVKEIWDSADMKRTPAEWCLRWVFDQPEVSLVLSGMSTMDQVVENVRTAENAESGALSDDEKALIKKVGEKYDELLKVNCTGCAYCMPCPNEVNIPMNFTAYNDYYMFNDTFRPKTLYNIILAPENRASNCAECGECEEKCPQHINIIDELKKTNSLLGQ